MDFTLPIGVQKDGKTIKSMEVKELDGYARRILTDIKKNKNAAKVVTGLLGHCLMVDGKSIGDVLAQRMFVVDRNAALVALQRESNGDNVVAHYNCVWCNQGFEFEDNLALLDCQILPEGELLETVTVQLDKGFKDSEDNVHRDVTMRVPTGQDEEVTAHMFLESYQQWCSTIIIRLTTKFGDLDMDKFAGLGVKVIDAISARDIDKLIAAVNTELPGYKTKHDVICANCQKVVTVSQDMSSFFLPNQMVNMR